MKSISETGHAKNVALLEKMKAYCVGYGNMYKPSKSSIQLENMQQLLVAARNAMQTVTNTYIAHTNAVNARMEVFNELKPLIGRVINALAAVDVPEKTLSDARAIYRRIRGVRASKKEETVVQTTTMVTEPNMIDATEDTAAESVNEPTNGTESSNGKTTRYNSSAQTSKDQLIEHVARLVALLETEPAYQPNEEELQVAALQQYLERLRSLNSAVNITEVTWSNARIQRDELLYLSKDCVYNVAKDVKLYVKSVFGPSNLQYKQVSKLRFTKPR